MDEVEDLKIWLRKKEGEPLALSYKLNIGILNVLWSVTCGRWEKSALHDYYSLIFRKLHAQQQEFQAVYECIDKLTQVSFLMEMENFNIF